MTARLYLDFLTFYGSVFWEQVRRFREHIPTEDQTRALLENASQEFTLIYQALRHSGARPNELCRAQIGNIETDPDDPSIRMIVLREHKTARKTGKPRIIVIGQKLRKFIENSISPRGGESRMCSGQPVTGRITYVLRI